MTSNKKLAKGMALVLIANIVSMIFNVLLNFIQPKFLSVNSYAAIKTFALYMSCAGLFHLGYEDGMYLKYGGKDADLINKDELSINISTLRIFQTAVALVTFAVGVMIREPVLAIFAVFLLPYNMTMHYRLLFQATGEFSLYGRILNVSSIILFILNIILIFVFHTDRYQLYLGAYIVVYLTVWIVLEVYITIKKGVKYRAFTFSAREFAESIKSGFLIMIGNFSSIFLTSMDRWFVKFLLDSLAFAEYSFAVSIEHLLNVAVTPFTITLYNYFCQETDREKIIRMRDIVCVFSVFLVSAAFPVKFIIDRWLPHYKGAENVIYYLFSAQVLFIIIKSIYVNLYKAQKRQGEYFVKLIIVLATGALFNAICYYFMHNKDAMAIGTLFSAILWFILCQFDFKELQFNLTHYIYIAAEIALFNFAGFLFRAIPGFLLYIVGSIIIGLTILRNDFIMILKDLVGFVYSRKGRVAKGV